ncbi:MAG: hypothetical protein V4506_15230 [Bacteroidota bacterium]
MSPRKKSYPRDLPWGSILNGLGLLFLILGLLLYILYSHRYGIWYRFVFLISGVMILFSLIGFQIKYLEVKGKGRGRRFLNWFISFTIIISAFSGIFFLKTYYDELQLRKHGTITYGTVIGYETGGRGGYSHYATFEFVFENDNYIQKAWNSNDHYKIGDRLILTISKNDPEIFEVIGVVK